MEEITKITLHKAYADGVEAGIARGRTFERSELILALERQICFDAKADDDGRCAHHGGKCYELGLLIKAIQAKHANNE